MEISLKNHFKLMAGYNQRLNNQVYEAAGKLTHSELNKDLKAYFKSIQGTLNHILTGDLLWLSRFKNHFNHFHSLDPIDSFPSFQNLDQISYTAFEDLFKARKNLDKLIIKWVENDILDCDFGNSIQYKDTKGKDYQRNFAELLAHFFNHQTHHRGQVSTLLSQFDLEIGITDFLIDIPNG